MQYLCKYKYIVPIVTGSVFISSFYATMKDIYRTPHKTLFEVPTPMKIKIIDFIMASLYASIEASFKAVIAYMISLSTVVLIDCVRIITTGSEEEKKMLKQKLSDIGKQFEDEDKIIRACDKLGNEFHQERIAIIRNINRDIEENNRKGYPFRMPISI